ncbi:hypothetical protein ACFX1X_019516 [Malus domestica]
MERMVEESELEKLEYLDMVLKETVRLHPVAPLLLPHSANEDCNANGFHIPGKSRVMINIWAIGRDPNVWTDVEKFVPERFDGRSIDVRGRDFHFIPAMQLGITMYLGQARTAVIDGSKGEMGDLENNFMGAAFKLGLQLYDEILRIGFDPDLFTYTALIRGHCVRGDMKEAEELFTKIHKSGLPIDHVPYRIFFKEYC